MLLEGPKTTLALAEVIRRIATSQGGSPQVCISLVERVEGAEGIFSTEEEDDLAYIIDETRQEELCLPDPDGSVRYALHAWLDDRD
jgi:hypothetical protein